VKKSKPRSFETKKARQRNPSVRIFLITMVSVSTCHETEYGRQRSRRRRKKVSLVQSTLRLVPFLLLFLIDSSNHHCLWVDSFVIPAHRSTSFPSSVAFSSPTTKTTTTTTILMGIKGFRSWFESTFPNAMMAPLIPSQGAHDTFDHVLIDMNQVLHVVLRKSRSDGHALTLLMKELDAICTMATPTQSLVLALDGPLFHHCQE
jgi:XRN 5'-3' exonuclease N-terminus